MANKKPEDSNIKLSANTPAENAKLRGFGVMPKGKTGCTTCDAMGYIHCRCPARGKSGGDGYDERDEDAKGKRSTPGTDQSTTSGKGPTSTLPIIPKSTTLGQLPKLIITLERQTNVKLTPDEIKALQNNLQAMKDEFKKFVNSLHNKDVPIDKSKYKAEIVNNSLVLTIPNAKHHDDFIAHLMSKGFVNAPSLTANQNQTQNPAETKGPTAPTPLRTTLTLKPPGL